MTPDISMAGFLERNSRKYHVYATLVACLLSAIAALPFLFIDVSINCSGSLKPAAESIILKATATGFINKVYAKENLLVKKGEILFELHSHETTERIKYFEGRILEMQQMIKDLNILINSGTGASRMFRISESLSTSLYKQVLLDYMRRLNEKAARLKKIEIDRQRAQTLFDGGVIAAVEMENMDFEWHKAADDVTAVVQAQMTEWERQTDDYKQQLSGYQNDLNQQIVQQKALHIIAPISGSVQQVPGVYPGSYVFSSQELGYISPDTSLIAEIYVPPNDIGLLRKDMDVRIQVMAFNYNQWGLLHGRVKQIADDVMISDGQPLFMVTCFLQQDHLELINGYRGYLKKGMTVQARFMVARRSLWQLLYDEMDDWMNPNL
ncbi:MAG: HlyD family efflux transporter periplasmic adaptor subunit [Chryseolinea sp.]